MNVIFIYVFICSRLGRALEMGLNSLKQLTTSLGKERREAVVLFTFTVFVPLEVEQSSSK